VPEGKEIFVKSRQISRLIAFSKVSSGSGEFSPSPPLEERDGERRLCTTPAVLGVAAFPLSGQIGSFSVLT
jgi:hypothetical protein